MNVSADLLIIIYKIPVNDECSWIRNNCEVVVGTVRHHTRCWARLECSQVLIFCWREVRSDEPQHKIRTQLRHKDCHCAACMVLASTEHQYFTVTALLCNEILWQAKYFSAQSKVSEIFQCWTEMIYNFKSHHPSMWCWCSKLWIWKSCLNR